MFVCQGYVLSSIHLSRQKTQQTLDTKSLVMSYINYYICYVEVLPCIVFVCQGAAVLSSVCLSKDYDSTPKTHIKYASLYIHVTMCRLWNVPMLEVFMFWNDFENNVTEWVSVKVSYRKDFYLDEAE